MNDSRKTGSAPPLPITGSGCGIRPSQEALDSEFEVDFSQASGLLKTEESKPDKDLQTSVQSEYEDK